MTDHENIPVLQANFRAAVIRAVTNTGNNPEDPQIRKRIINLEKEHVTYLEQSEIYISGRTDIPGFRQLVFLCQNHDVLHQNHHENRATNPIRAIAVTSDLRLLTGTIGYRSIVEQKPDMMKQVIEILSGSDESNLEFINGDIYYNLRGPIDSLEMFNDHVGRCELGFDAIHEINCFVNQQNKDRHMRVCHAIMAALDEKIVYDMRKNDLMLVEHGRWLTGGDGASKDVVRARQQAIRTYPLLSGVFQVNNVLKNVIDARRSLSKAIADYFNVDKHRVKRLSNLTWQQVGFKPKPPEQAYPMISRLLHLPDKIFPKNTKQFQQCEILFNFGAYVYGKDKIMFARGFSENKNPWKLINRMEQTSGHNVCDAMRFLVKKLLVPAMFNKGGHAAVPPFYRHMESYNTLTSKKMDEIRTSFKVGELLDWSDRYHRNIMHYEDCLDTVSSEQTEQTWPGLLDTLDFGNGTVARELNSAQALKTQGILERHCVGGYLSCVLDGKNRNGKFTLIFSIEKNNTILSTAEIECIQKTDGNNGIPHIQAEIRQNRARRNRTPCEDAIRIANQIVARLESIPPEACRTYLDNLKQACLEYDRQSNIDIHVRYCGFDPFDRTMMERAWEELSPALPRRFRRDGLDAFIEHTISDISWHANGRNA